MADDNFTSQLYLLLVVFGVGALIIALYYFFKVACSDGGHPAGRRRRPPIARTYISRGGEPPSSTENSMADLIPAHKFQKGAGLVEEDGGGSTCAVCLCDFDEGEELRTLPECMHSFHVPCIDMWLYSHSTCPVCRTHAIMSLSQVLQCLSDNHSPTLPPSPLRPQPPALQHGSTGIPDSGGNILV